MPSWLFHLTQVVNRLWVTVALYSALGLGAALASAQFDHLVPSDFPLKLGSDSVDDILSILASSMLAVATFSLTTLVTAYTSIVGNGSPRAAELLVSDGAIRSSLATFVGAFIYGIVGIVAVHTGYYGSEGRVILFFVTLVVLFLVVLAMLRWIGQLSRLGQVGDLVGRVADAAGKALRTRPIVVARCGRQGDAPEGRRVVPAGEVGFVQNVDLEGLQRIAAEHGLQLHLQALPGEFVHASAPLLWTEGPNLTGACAKDLRSRITIGPRRTFDQDPRYGLTVLGEIAARALSPGVNDPGVARDVIARTTRTLSEWAGEDGEANPCPNVTVPALEVDRLLQDALEPVARHGAGNPAVHRDLQDALYALTRTGDERLAEAARKLSTLALDHAREALRREEDVAEAVRCANRVLRRAD